MDKSIIISIRSARVNANLSQLEVTDILKRDYNIKITRQKLANFEKDSTEMPINLAKALEQLYAIPKDNIFFGIESTLSYTKK